jgi:DNA invertase Pin-like site-specific DNA recombinase
VKAIGYVRVSTREQAEIGHSLAHQRNALLAEAEHRGWDMTIIEDAGYTARNMDRPGIKRAMRLLKTGKAEALVVTKLDRVARSTVDFGKLLEKAMKQRWNFVTQDFGLDMTTTNGRLVARILAAVAEWESETIGDRVKDGMAQAKAEGARFGKGRMADNTTVARILELRAQGLSFARIAEVLDDGSIPTPNGGRRWYGSTVSRIYIAATKESAA